MLIQSPKNLEKDITYVYNYYELKILSFFEIPLFRHFEIWGNFKGRSILICSSKRNLNFQLIDSLYFTFNIQEFNLNEVR